MSQPTASQRVARSTRAAAPVYAAHAASVARGQTRTAAAAENNSSGSESDDAADANDDDTPAQQRKQRRSRTTSSAAASASASSCSVRLEHAEPLQVADRPALVEQTRRLLLWRLSDDEEEGDRKEEDEEQPQQSNEQLDSTCLSSMLSSMPASACAALYALELDDGAEGECAALGGAIDRALRSSEAEAELNKFVQIVRAWNKQAAAAHSKATALAAAAGVAAPAAGGGGGGGGVDDLWSLLQAARIPPRHLVTFCYVLLASPHSVRRSTAFLAAALYLSLLEHSARTNVALASFLQEQVLRRVQVNVRAWARADIAAKESGVRKQKIKGGGSSKSTAATAMSDDPFGDESMAAAGGEEAADAAAWMQSAMARAFILDFLAQCRSLYAGTSASLPSAGRASAAAGAALSAAVVLPLAKHAEIASHLVETLVDLTRTDVEPSSSSKRGRSSGASAAAGDESALPGQAFDVLATLMHPAHGAPMHTLQLLLKHMLHSALLSFGSSGSGGTDLSAASAAMPRHLLRVHRAALAFVQRLVRDALTQQHHNHVVVSLSDVHRSLHCFLQHMLLRAAERADYRKMITSAVMRDFLAAAGEDDDRAIQSSPSQLQLLGLLRTSHVAFVERMARNKRPSVRLMALELAEAAMQARWSMTQQPVAAVSVASTAQQGKHRKSAPSFADQLEEVKEEEDSSMAPAAAAAVANGAQIPMLMDIDLPAMAPLAASSESEELSAPLARSLLSLLLSRCSDASPSVRARALAAMAHVLSFCAEHYTARDDDDDAPSATRHQQLSNEQRRLRATFARLMSQRLSGPAAELAANMTPTLRRTNSAPGPAGTPNRSSIGGVHAPLASPSKSFSFMHTPLQATLSARKAQGGRGAAADADLSVAGLQSFLGAEQLAGAVLPAFHPAQAGVRDLLGVLYRRSGDTKALVRRAALQALECILLAAAAEDRPEEDDAQPEQQQQKQGEGASDDGDDLMADVAPRSSFSLTSAQPRPPSLLACLTASDLQIFYDGCFDPSLSLRKQSLSSLTSLLRRYSDVSWPRVPEAAAALANLQRVWLGAVLPLVQDRERTVVDKCVEAVQQLLLQPAAEWLAAAHGGKKSKSSGATTSKDAAVWHLFGAMDGEMVHYLQLILLQLLRAGSVPAELVRHALKEVAAQAERAAQQQQVQQVEASSVSAIDAQSERAAERARACWVLLECCSLTSSSPSSSSVDLTPTLRSLWSHLSSGQLRMEEPSLLRLLSCVGHLAAGGRWKRADLAAMADYLVAALTAQVQAPVKHPKKGGGQTASFPPAPSAEVIKKQLWILNSAAAALDKLQADENGEESGVAAAGNWSSPLALPDWEGALLAACQKQLEAFVSVASAPSAAAVVSSASATTDSGAAVTPSSVALWVEPSLCTALFTLGEVVLQHQRFNPKTTLSAPIVQLVQTFVAPSIRVGGKPPKQKTKKQTTATTLDSSALSDESSLQLSSSMDESLQLPPATLDTSFNASVIATDADLSTASSSSSTTRTEPLVVPLSASLRGHAFLALGKLMLRSELLAKKNVALLVCELERAPDSPHVSALVQNNVLLLLCDLVRTYTAIVDPYLASLTALLASPNRMLRKHTVMVLQVLLQEEYIKMRSAAHATASASAAADGSGASSVSVVAGSGASSMLYRYLRCLVDEDASIRALVQTSLGSVLRSSEAPNAAATGSKAAAAAAATNVHGTRMHLHFTELIYFLNGCHEHPVLNQFGGGGGGKGKLGTAAAAAAASRRVAPSSNDAPFALVGPLGSPNASRRFELYRLALAHLNDEQKFLLTAKLHADVLQLVVEDAFLTAPWTAALRVNDVVQDALLVLASDALQLAGSSSSTKGAKAGAGDSAEALEAELHELALAAEDNAEAGAGGAAQAAASAHAQSAAKAKLLHKLLKKSTMESCLPVLLELRQSFARAHSPLEKWLMHLLSRLHSSFRNEVDELFSGANKIVAKELAFDIRRYEQRTDEGGAQVKAEQERWARLDFTPMPPAAAAMQLQRSASEGWSGIAAMDSAADASTARRLSANAGAAAGGAVASTPIKVSSLSSLRMGGGVGGLASPMAHTPARGGGAAAAGTVPGSALRRSLSTPTHATVASVVAAMATPAGKQSQGVLSLRTPGKAAISTPAMLRRAPSTPLSSLRDGGQPSASKRARRSTGGGAVTPSRLLREGSDEDASTDDDDDESENGAARAGPDAASNNGNSSSRVLQSSLSSLRVSNGSTNNALPASAAPPALWKVAIHERETDEHVPPAPVAAAGKKKRGAAASASASVAVSGAGVPVVGVSSLGFLSAPSAARTAAAAIPSVGGKKRKQHTSPTQPAAPLAAMDANAQMTAAAPAASRRRGPAPR